MHILVYLSDIPDIFGVDATDEAVVILIELRKDVPHSRLRCPSPGILGVFIIYAVSRSIQVIWTIRGYYIDEAIIRLPLLVKALLRNSECLFGIAIPYRIAARCLS